MPEQPAPPAGWHIDPYGSGQYRWWDGRSWTSDTRANSASPSLAVYTVPSSVQPYAAAPLVQAPMAPVGVWRSRVDDRPVVIGMGSALRVVFAKYVVFDGRASRSEFWYLQLFVGIVTASMFALLLFSLIWPPLLLVGGLVYLGLIAGSFALLLPSLAVSVRRLRDAGFHWAWIFLSAVPLGSIALLVMWAQPSKYP